MKDTAYISSLVQKVKKKDVLAMQSLYESFSKEMLATSRRITNNLSDAQDIVQDSFLTSFQKIGQLNDGKKYGGWLKQIVINCSLKVVKSKRSYSCLEELTIEVSEEQEGRWYEGVSFDLIKQAILSLPDGSREVFSLYLLEGYKHKEISKALDISESTSKSQYRYALKLLREKLKHVAYE